MLNEFQLDESVIDQNPINVLASKINISSPGKYLTKLYNNIEQDNFD